MIKAALEYMRDLGQNEEKIITVNGRTYSTRELRSVKEPMPETLEIHSLSSIVEYINADAEGFLKEGYHLLLHILDYGLVKVFLAKHGEHNQRTHLFTSRAPDIAFPFETFISPEKFIINASAKFIASDDLAAVLAIVGNVQTEEVLSFSDDGISQQVTAKSGIAKIANVALPPKVTLKPYRTFLEVDQPESQYLFRAKKAEGLPYFGLFEADGGMWKLEAVKLVKEYLKNSITPALFVNKKVFLMG